jgi:hypothetical protein
MTDYALGGAIRAALAQQGPTPGRPADPRIIEAMLPQLVQADQQDLLPALSFLLRSRALASALAQPSGTDDGRIASRLLAEVQAQYNPAICQRLQGVIQGMVGIPQQSVSAPNWSVDSSAQPVATPNPHPVTTVVTGSSGGGSGWVVGLLCFLIGIVGSGLVLLLWLQQQNKPPAAGSVAPAAQPTAPAPPAFTPPPMATPAPAPAGTDAINAAVTSIQELYGALSDKDYGRAASLFGPMAADQFDPTFFNQFERVTLADLRQTSSAGSMLNFEGVVTFVYRNGDVQTETRSFTVDTRNNPALITSSEFGRVIQPR